jgi:hypothetical protein
MDDKECVNDFANLWNTKNRYKPCWWHDEEDKIYWKEPNYNIAAIVFCGIFGMISIIMPTVLGIHWYLNKK